VILLKMVPEEYPQKKLASNLEALSSYLTPLYNFILQ